MKTTKVLPFCNKATFECFEVVDPPLLPDIRVTRPRCSSNHACSSSLPRVLVTIAILSLSSLTLNKLGQPGLDSQHLVPPRQRLHFLEKASRRVCASHAAHWQDRRRRRRGSTSPPLLLLLLLLLLPLLLLLVLLLLLSGRTELTGSRVAASTHDRPHPDPPPTLLDPPYCREKLLIALLCLRSTQAERLLRQGVNLNVPGVRGVLPS